MGFRDRKVRTGCKADWLRAPAPRTRTRACQADTAMHCLPRVPIGTRGEFHAAVRTPARPQSWPLPCRCRRCGARPRPRSGADGARSCGKRHMAAHPHSAPRARCSRHRGWRSPCRHGPPRRAEQPPRPWLGSPANRRARGLVALLGRLARPRTHRSTPPRAAGPATRRPAGLSATVRACPDRALSNSEVRDRQRFRRATTSRRRAPPGSRHAAAPPARRPWPKCHPRAPARARGPRSRAARQAAQRGPKAAAAGPPLPRRSLCLSRPTMHMRPTLARWTPRLMIAYLRNRLLLCIYTVYEHTEAHTHTHLQTNDAASCPSLLAPMGASTDSEHRQPAATAHPRAARSGDVEPKDKPSDCPRKRAQSGQRARPNSPPGWAAASCAEPRRTHLSSSLAGARSASASLKNTSRCLPPWAKRWRQLRS